LSFPLKFRPDGRFIIAQFADLHWHNGEEPDQQTRAMMERILDAERPDFVALTGDNIAGRPCVDPAESTRQVAAPMEERKIPWAGVFGNHDAEGSMDREGLMDALRSCPHCLSEPGPEAVSGVGNFTLRIRSAHREALAAALYFLDSGTYPGDEFGTYDWFKRDQIAWYLEQSRQLNAAYAEARSKEESSPQPIPSLAFFHIPLPEYNEAWDFKVCKGRKYENVYSPSLNSGFFLAMVEAGDVMGTFVGHDHVNDFEGTLFGIRLCYGRGGGFSTYGREGMLRGARMIELREGERSFETWMSLEDGTVETDPPTHEPRGQRVLSDH
jgi:hypothetical protein